MQGRVYNPATQQYVRSAEVRLEGTGRLAANTSRNSALGGGGQSKYTQTITAAPKFEYRDNAVTVDGQATYSRSFNNHVARLAYYFEPAGQLSVTVTQNEIRNLRETRRGTAEEFGLGDDPEYGSYEFQSPFNVGTSRRHRGLEVGYSQTLPFRHEALRGITLNTSYTRSYSNARRGNLLPHRVTSSVGYGYRRLRLRAGVVWRDDTPETTIGRFRRHDAKLDLGGEFRLTRHATLFFQGRNIFNGGQTWLETPPGAAEGQGAAVRLYENYGANWNFGVKGTF